MGELFIPCQRERKYGFHALLIRLETFIRRAPCKLIIRTVLRNTFRR